MKRRLSPSVRLSLALTSLVVSIACVAQVVGLLPESTTATLKGRKNLCETMAIHSSLAAERGDENSIRMATEAICARNPDILSAAVRRADGRLVAEIGDHQSHWTANGDASSATQVQVPVQMQDKRWGTVELRFAPLAPSGFRGVLADPAFRFISFIAAGCLIVYFVYLRMVMKRTKLLASATAGMPDRVRDALDTLVEGVLLLDKDQRIALANKAFAQSVGHCVEELEGLPVTRFRWMSPLSKAMPENYPWGEALEKVASYKGTILELASGAKGRRTFSINATPIVGDDGACRGTLATFDDLTPIQKKNVRLKRLLEKLKNSRSEIRVQNQQLHDLAKRDPLTGCLNRRAFFELAQLQWDSARRYGNPLSGFILDIDHFKSINDTYGHAIGDQALQQVAAALKTVVRSSDLLCRYGGEEFCILLPHVDADRAAQAAERFRREIAGRQFSNIMVTASFGVATMDTGLRDPHDLFDRADKALYAAKRSGRNCVVRWDKLPDDLQAGSTIKPPERPSSAETDVAIPFHAVTSLISALAFRDAPTAEHSRRVADLCVMMARGLLTESESYILEVAGLLHDIGKLGVPDSILRKPSALSEQEWQIMGMHDRMGEEIITAAFACPALSEIVRCHHAWFGGNPRHPTLPTQGAIPVGARILAIADAYDAIVSDRVYRKGRSREEAFVELRRCAGAQFDPVLVERFIELMLARDGGCDNAFPSLSKKTAFRIGLQIEKLATALDAQDMSKLALMASRLKGTASEHRLPQIFEVAAQLEQAIADGSEWVDIMEYSSDLLELCRSTQKSYLTTCSSEAPVSA